MFINFSHIDIYKYNLHLGSSKLALTYNFNINLLEGFRNDLSIYKIDKLFLNMVLNKNLICKLSKNYVNFTFLTTRKEFSDILEHNSLNCFENYKLWTKGMFGCFHNQFFFENVNKTNKFHKFNFWFTFRTDVVIMFNNTVLECKLPFLELRKKNIPAFTFIDTDSIISNYFFPIYSNDDSLIAINFYSNFFSYIILKSKKHYKMFNSFLTNWEFEDSKRDVLFSDRKDRLSFLKSILSKKEFEKEKLRFFNNKKLIKSFFY